MTDEEYKRLIDERFELTERLYWIDMSIRQHDQERNRKHQEDWARMQDEYWRRKARGSR